MKKFYFNKLFYVGALTIASIALMSNSSGRANIFGQAVTGAPGDSNLTCASSGCHSSGVFSPNGSITITDLDGNEVDNYIPGNTYDVLLSVNASGSPAAFGFQMSALSSDASPADDWSGIGSNMQEVQIGDRLYLEHNSPSSSNEFLTSWTAPESGTGDVTFYYSVNAVNGNGNPGGDGASNSSFMISEMTTSTSERLEESVNVFPNPTTQNITIEGISSAYNYSIFTMNGVKVNSARYTGKTTIDISNLETGLYVILLQTDAQTLSKKVFKQ